MSKSNRTNRDLPRYDCSTRPFLVQAEWSAVTLAAARTRHGVRRNYQRRRCHPFKGDQGGPKEGGLNIGQHEGLSM